MSTSVTSRPGAGLRTLHPQPRRSPLHGAGRTLIRIGTAVTLLLLWQGLSRLIDDPSSLPAPRRVATALWDLARGGQLADALLVSVRRVALGLALGIAIGTVLAVLAGLFRIGDDTVDPVVQMGKSIPVLAITPLFVLWMGIDETTKIAVIAFGTVFPIYVNLHAGIRSIDPRYLELGRVQRLGRLATIRHVMLPGALPNWFAGLRYAMGHAWILLVAAEMVNADAGLGYIVNQAQQVFRMDILLAALVVYGALGFGTDRLVHLLERSFLRWQGTP